MSASREEFWEWLNKCKCESKIEKDDYGYVNVSFFPEETEERNDTDPKTFVKI